MCLCLQNSNGGLRINLHLTGWVTENWRISKLFLHFFDEFAADRVVVERHVEQRQVGGLEHQFVVVKEGDRRGRLLLTGEHLGLEEHITIRFLLRLRTELVHELSGFCGKGAD